ncbi:MAG: DNA mismatch repair protein MutS [Candidatus Melainabacteria bacterium GWF2_37_15]|nr:MAG: DNA mismatch repair protein MutS [Candidatus Melainabacteria bacterium GWF2_37_15]
MNNLNLTKTCDINPEHATPMMQQFLQIKKQHQGVILFYRMGDFYEMFFEDAVLGAKELELTLTGRDGGRLGRIPMAGVPHKAADNYIARLLEKGHKVAICEQMEDAALAKGLVERKVVKTITAGTITDINLLQGSKNNYLAAVTNVQKSCKRGFAYVDISTGEFKISTLGYDQLISEINRIEPSEILCVSQKREIKPFQIVPEEHPDLPETVIANYNCTVRANAAFYKETALEKIKQAFNIKSLEAFGFPEYTEGLIAAGVIIDYLLETQQDNLPKFDVITPYETGSFVAIDSSARRNLELVQTVRDNKYEGSLMWAVNKTKTNMGARLLRKWIQQPLQDINEIKQRYCAVEELIENPKIRTDVANLLDKVYDIERLATKISNNSANGRDFISLRDSLKVLPLFGNILYNTKSPLLNKFSEKDEKISDFTALIDKTIVEEPPISIKEGNLIKRGVHEELDYLKSLLCDGQEWLADFEKREKERSGIKSLKVGYSKVFGYFIEITHANTAQVPNDYIRKQTLTSAERYITPELKQHENEILSAGSKSAELEYHTFCNFREYSKEFVDAIRDIAKSLAVLDVMLSFAQTAVEYNYVKPVIDKSRDLVIEEGRHPVIEQLLPLGSYVPNDLDITSPMLMILTGPNMAGKSTFMRQNALIIILAQIGSFVPAKSARIGIVDKIFTRVGAVDDLSTGQSTFMVEMTETASILNSATDRSFILLDEIGRGTSTYDGVAIAWSVAEHITQNIGARTIFATHYHELNIMCEKHPEIRNFRMTISENEDEIIFLRKVVPGGASRSYGIQVAKMAGLPASVIARSQQLMTKMQKDYAAQISTKKRNNSEVQADTPQLSLFIE